MQDILNRLKISVEECTWKQKIKYKMGLKILDFSLLWARPASYGDIVKSYA